MTVKLKRLQYAVISEPVAGETECGDQFLVKEIGDSILVAVADGLGHGDEAALAAKKAIQILDSNADASIGELVIACDYALQETRGTALTIIHISDKNILSYLTVGNVAGVCWNLDETSNITVSALVLEGGIVGARLPFQLLVKNKKMKPGDIFILATDGVNSEFEIEPPRFESPQAIAKRLFNKFRITRDDGLILVAQLL